jgi:hypothetical protein
MSSPDRRTKPVITLRTAANLTSRPIQQVVEAIRSGALPSTTFPNDGITRVSYYDLNYWHRRTPVEPISLQHSDERGL